MDSMRGLRTSLPHPSRTRRQPIPTPELLLQSFKQAALSVTALYKQAAADRNDLHQQGYQDAIDDLLAFLDKENIGLQDGEGWKIRSWATERASGSSGDDVQGNNTGPEEDDEEVEEQDTRERSLSPKTDHDASPSESLILPPVPVATATPLVDSRSSTTIPPASTEVKSAPTFVVPSSDFAFRSTHAMPSAQDADMESSDSQTTVARPSNTMASPISINYTSRSHRGNNRSNRHNNRTNNSNSLGGGAGSKRKVPLESWFDISGFNGKDGSQGGAGGGKRGRFV